MSGGVARWDSPLGHPVVLLASGGSYGAACGCGGWQARVPDLDAALTARASYLAHLRRAVPGWTPPDPEDTSP
jgi:hypothetical protein